ncbi:MAG: OmpH family outer membrane protein [Flavobacteriales bacterium]|nr:OmpH family outer membrane protein [Flavobacteriales bacterium]
MKNLKSKWLIVAVVFTLGLVAAKTVGTKSKVGYISTSELWAMMPEKKAADEQLKNMETQMVAYIQQEQKTFEAGVNKFVQDSASMTELIKKQTIQKLQQQQENMQTLPKAANEELVKKQEELYAPIRDKMQKAIDAVADENGYDYIFDSSFGNIVFVKNEGDNVLPLVKIKLDLK